MNARLLSIAATAALALGLVAAPASAGAITVYIDDDGTAGAAGCNGSTVVPTSIQAAVDVSGPGDTILVCPGAYPERVDIAGAGHKGLTIRATKRWAAKVNPIDGEFGAIVRIASPRVTLQWLKVVAPTASPCTEAQQGILVDGVAKATILSNLVLASPAGPTINTNAGLSEGIVINDGSTGAVVNHNIVRAFKDIGILVQDADAMVVNNSIQYWHAAPNSANVACRKAPRRTTPGGTIGSTGIHFDQSTGAINLNAITSAPDGAQAFFNLIEAIRIEGSDGLRIRRNLVTGGYSGLILTDSDAAVIEGNVLVGTVLPQASARTTPALIPSSGLQIANGTGSTVRENRVAHYADGLLMAPGSTGNQMRDNDATGNATDCKDAGGPAPAGVTQNSWISNLGNFDNPAGICDDHAITPIPGSPT